MEQEAERLFNSLPILFEGVEPYLRMYDIAGAFDSIEAKLETIGKYCKTILVERGSLDQEHFVYELMLKDNEKHCERWRFHQIMFKKNKEPYISKSKRKYRVSSLVDRIVYGDQEVKWKEEEIIRRVNAGFENLKWNVGCSDGITAVLSP